MEERQESLKRGSDVVLTNSVSKLRKVEKVEPVNTENNNSLHINRSIHSCEIEEIHNIPLHVLIRPIEPVLHEYKVLALIHTLQNTSTTDFVPPVDVKWITGREGGHYFYLLAGSHRYAAHERLHRPTIPCKLIKSTVQDLKLYLGASTPDLK